MTSTLSDKIYRSAIHIKDVKEFIKELNINVNRNKGFNCHNCKEEWKGVMSKMDIMVIIKKLAGKELSNG